VPFFAGNEISAVYDLNTDLWQQLHTLVTRYYTTVVLSDSSGRLPIILRSEEQQHYVDQLKKWYGVVHPSLNSTKISLMNIPE